VVTDLIEDLAPFFDDGAAGLQRLVSRMPLLLEVDRAYIARISPDGVRFTVTQASKGDWPDLLGYTQSAARLPAFARGALKSGVQATIDDALTFPFTPQQRKMLWYGGLRGTVLTPIRSNGIWIGALIVDVLKQQRIWDFLVLDACRSLALAIGARLAKSTFSPDIVLTDGEAALMVGAPAMTAKPDQLVREAGRGRSRRRARRSSERSARRDERRGHDPRRPRTSE